MIENNMLIDSIWDDEFATCMRCYERFYEESMYYDEKKGIYNCEQCKN